MPQLPRFDNPAAFARHTRAAVLAGDWDQAVVAVPAARAPDAACDVGVKLAIAFDRVHTSVKGPVYLSRDGAAAAGEALSMQLQHLSALLHVCGAVQRPFAAQRQPWPRSRDVVWDRLGLLGATPDFAGVRERVADRTAMIVDMNWIHWHRRFGVDVRRMRPADRYESFWQDLLDRLLGIV